MVVQFMGGGGVVYEWGEKDFSIYHKKILVLRRVGWKIFI